MTHLRIDWNTEMQEIHHAEQGDVRTWRTGIEHSGCNSTEGSAPSIQEVCVYETHIFEQQQAQQNGIDRPAEEQEALIWQSVRMTGLDAPSF